MGEIPSRYGESGDLAMTEDDYQILLQNQASAAGTSVVPSPPKRQKYGAKRKEVDGIMFASSREAARYIELKALQAAGVITDLALQPRFTLQYACSRMVNNKYTTLRKIEYVADFMYRDEDGNVRIEDVKGVRTPVFNLKEKMFRAKYPLLRLEIIK